MPKLPDIPATVHCLGYQAGPSDKVYNVVICDNGLVILQWGRRYTVGQSSVTNLGTADDAESLGMRQVYAKKSKGYVSKWSGRVMLPADLLDDARRTASGNSLWEVVQNKINEGEFSGLRDAVLTHYKEFVDQATSLLNAAETEDFETLAAKHEALETAWADIKDQHAQVQTTMDLANATFARKLLGI